MIKIKISVVVSAHNEEQKIRDCLESVGFADEIIVVDSGSKDATVTIAKEYDAKVFKRENNPMLNVNKNFGFSKATGDWVLSLDADERVTPELREEIKEVIENSNGKWKMLASLRSGENGKSDIVGYWIPRKNIIFGKWIQSDMWWPDYQLRLFRRGKGRFGQKHVHEYIEVDGETKKLREPLVHYNYSSIAQYLYKMDTIYTENEVANLIASDRTITWIEAIRFPLQDFLKTFFARKGYRDGLHGLILSFLQAFYMEIVFLKVWEKQGFPEHNNGDFLDNVYREIMKFKKEFRYWFLTSVIQETKNPLKKFFYRLLRKRTV